MGRFRLRCGSPRWESLTIYHRCIRRCLIHVRHTRLTSMPETRVAGAMASRSLTILLFACVGSSDQRCANEVITRIASPDARYDVVTFQRACGATTGFSTHVSVLRSGDSVPADSGGNVLVADTDHGKAPVGPSGGPRVEVRWSGRDTLEIRLDHRARILHSVDSIASIRATHVSIPPGGGA